MGVGTEVVVSYAAFLREMYPDLDPVVDDLFLLEAHQVANLPERAPARELAAVLHAHPRLHRFLVTRHPPIEGFLSQLLAEHGPAGEDDLETCEEELVWEIADWIVYQRAPESYDAGTHVAWDVAAVTELVDLEGKVVIDAGAGTGRVAFAVAPLARHVFAVEPVGTFRRFMRDKAVALGIANLFVLDGLLHTVPLPAASADVMLTCQAIGWNLAEELAEIERVVKPGGIAIHMFGSATAKLDNPYHQPLVAAGYQPDTFENGDLQIIRYWKRRN